MAYEGLEDNKNAEKWDLETATKLMESALELSEDEERTYDFIGEIARDLKQYKEIFGYLSKKFVELEYAHKRIISNCEANCFYNGKKQNIVPSLAIMNLKSNHGWTDRNDLTSGGGKISAPPAIEFIDTDGVDED